MTLPKRTEKRQVASYTDWRGHTVEVGSLVLYPRASGRSVEVMEGEVVEIFETRECHTRGRERPTEDDWSKWSTPRTTIRPIRSSRFDSQKSWRGSPKRNAIVFDHENVTVVR